jgi:Icc-related predicted phosphoesterase
MTGTDTKNRGGFLKGLFSGATPGPRDGELRLFYASDIHGSTICWKKFVQAARYYNATALIMGGDVAGKAIVPIAALPDSTYKAFFLGEERRANGTAELSELSEAIGFNGMYPWVAAEAEIARIGGDPEAKSALFLDVMATQLRAWIDLADSRLDGTDTSLYVMGGNDDPWSLDDVLREGKRTHFCDDSIVRVGSHEMLSCSNANMTPWRAPRDLDDDALYVHLKGLADQLEDPRSAIFNTHVPPYDSGLDLAVEIDPTDLSPVYVSGQPHVIPVGSRAVRQLIEEYQPLLGLHGHIHESRAEKRIGRTLVLNPGSEYNSGRLHGVVVVLSTDAVVRHQFVSG